MKKIFLLVLMLTASTAVYAKKKAAAPKAPPVPLLEQARLENEPKPSATQTSQPATSNNDSAGLIQLTSEEIKVVKSPWGLFISANTEPLIWNGSTNSGNNRSYQLRDLGSTWMTGLEVGLNRPSDTYANVNYGISGLFGYAQRQVTLHLGSGDSESNLRQIKWALSPRVQWAPFPKKSISVLGKLEVGQTQVNQTSADVAIAWNETHRYVAPSIGAAWNFWQQMQLTAAVKSYSDLNKSDRWDISQNTYQLGIEQQW